MLRITDRDRARFWALVPVRPDDPDACWLWAGAVQSSGYGHFWLDGAMRLAHRVAIVLAGRVLPARQLALHECPRGGTKLCVRETHLVTGTQKRNMRIHYQRRAIERAQALEVLSGNTED